MLVSSMGLGSEKGCAGDARQKLKSTDQTSRQRGRPASTNPILSKKLSETIGMCPRWVPDTRTDCSTDCRS
jgi:hypothetical protein